MVKRAASSVSPLGEETHGYWMETWPQNESLDSRSAMDFPHPFDLPADLGVLTAGTSNHAGPYVIWPPANPNSPTSWYDWVKREHDCDECRRNSLGSHYQQHEATQQLPQGNMVAPMSMLHPSFSDATQYHGLPAIQAQFPETSYPSPTTQHGISSAVSPLSQGGSHQHLPQGVQELPVGASFQPAPIPDDYSHQAFQQQVYQTQAIADMSQLAGPGPQYNAHINPNPASSPEVHLPTATPFNSPNTTTATTTTTAPPFHQNLLPAPALAPLSLPQAPVPIPPISHARRTLSSPEERYHCNHLQPDGQPCAAEFPRHWELDRHVDTLHNKSTRTTCHDCNPPQTYSRHDCWRRHWKRSHAVRFVEERGDWYFRELLDWRARAAAVAVGGDKTKKTRQRGKKRVGDGGDGDDDNDDRSGKGGVLEGQSRGAVGGDETKTGQKWKKGGLVGLSEEEEIALGVWDEMRRNGRQGPLFEERKRALRWYMRDFERE
ncbi:hypothetical protein QBC41DRAFT_327201 [Cercophora samala]|uniref:Uncharacterized protein n=1 Tax=Cercophora samala TaxID=330535 RepID=A0AA39Z8P1_9PEZI|nr:hypothetical protein QBC41DRAFT_327201 [Cercophora samala]